MASNFRDANSKPQEWQSGPAIGLVSNPLVRRGGNPNKALDQLGWKVLQTLAQCRGHLWPAQNEREGV